jgi:hypothetical protein
VDDENEEEHYDSPWITFLPRNRTGLEPSISAVTANP